MIIDGDGHYVELPDQWVQYVPGRLRDRVFVEHDERGRPQRLVADDQTVELGVQPGATAGFGDNVTPGGLNPGRPRGLHIDQGHPGGWSGPQRLAVHDAEGIDAAVMFPSVAPIFCHRLRDPDVALAVAAAINRWAADMCSAAPRELYSVAALPGLHPDLAAKEMRRCVEEHGFVAGCVRPMPLLDGRTLDHPSFEPIWAAAEDLDIPITIHNVSTRETPIPQAGTERYPSFVLSHAVAHPFEGMLAFASLLQGQVFERHPALRVGFMESSCGWAPFWLDRLHEHIEHLGWMADPPLKSDPRELFARRCVIGCEGDEPMAAYVQSRFGEQTVVWSSDFPHFDVESPYVTPVLSRPDMTDSQKEALLWQAAATFYKLDTDAITTSRAKRQQTTAKP
jgi:predicted TIM-barrel fold metal-dependent hydrolase